MVTWGTPPPTTEWHIPVKHYLPTTIESSDNSSFSRMSEVVHWRIRRGTRDAPHLVPISFVFMKFFLGGGGIGQIIGWHPHLWSWHSTLGNLRSATALSSFSSVNFFFVILQVSGFNQNIYPVMSIVQYYLLGKYIARIFLINNHCKSTF